jgi:hypothetical protein
VGFGVLLSLAVFITDNLALGQYLHLFYGILLLPLLPSASKTDFFSSMSLSSLWKYCLYGLMLSFTCLSSKQSAITDGSSTFNLNLSGTLSFSSVVQLLAISVLTYMLVTAEHCRYRLIFVWAAVVLLNVILIFKYCS